MFSFNRSAPTLETPRDRCRSPGALVIQNSVLSHRCSLDCDAAGMDYGPYPSNNLSILLSHPHHSFDKISPLGFNFPFFNNELTTSPLPTENNTCNVLMEGYSYEGEPVTTRPINDSFSELAAPALFVGSAYESDALSPTDPVDYWNCTPRASITVNLPRRRKTFDTLSLEEFEAEIAKLQREVDSSYLAEAQPEMKSPYGEMSCASESTDASYNNLEIHVCRWQQCGTMFPTLDMLVEHISNDHLGKGKSTYVCYWEGCERGCRPFVKRHKISNHLRKHTGERPYPCTMTNCGKRFTRRDSLAAHMKTHGSSPKFTCNVEGCGENFRHLKTLQKHGISHQELAADGSQDGGKRYHPYSAMGYTSPTRKSKSE